ncbi:MAG: biotin--[acetyl-CoA-carboxylase] ligase, partial [Thermodesulfobacteriota bacterium]
INFVIVGIGINVNQMEQDFPTELRSKATSLRIELGRTVHRVRLLQDILKRWEKNYSYALESRKGFNTILSRWKAKCPILGKKIVVEYGKHEVQGIAEDIDAKGCLLISTEGGELKRLFAGDVKVIGEATR